MTHDDDVFISYASEDRDRYVRPLVGALEERGLTVWWDRERLLPGDSLTRALPKGMEQARVGVVVLSAAYLEKDWPRRELAHLLESHDGRLIPVLLPDLKREELVRRWPTLADVVSADADPQILGALAGQIVRTVARQITDVLEAVTPRTRAVLVQYEVDASIPEDHSLALPPQALRDQLAYALPFRPFGRLLPKDQRPRDERAWARAFQANELFGERLRVKDDETKRNLLVHLFGLAPLVLMFHLGYCLRRLPPRPLVVYQTPEQHGPWIPLYDTAAASAAEPFFAVEGIPPVPQEGNGHVAIAIGVTHPSCDEAVRAFQARYQTDLTATVRVLPARGSSSSAVRGPEDLASAAQQFRKVLDDIRHGFPRASSVLLTISGPTSLAVALGAAIRNVHKPMTLHHSFSDDGGWLLPVHSFGEGH